MTSLVCHLNWDCFLLRGGFPARDPDVVGSNPNPATKKLTRQDAFNSRSAFSIFAVKQS